jgi:hypothetical protein
MIIFIYDIFFAFIGIEFKIKDKKEYLLFLFFIYPFIVAIRV